jgi:hypothetical protein
MPFELLISTTQPIIFDWARYLIPFATTLIGILIGRYISRNDAKKARQQTGIEKDKQEAYEKISDYLFNILKTFDKYKMYGFEPLNENIEEKTQKIILDIDTLNDKEPNTRHIIVLNIQSQNLYHSIIEELNATKELANKLMLRVNETRDMPHPAAADGIKPRGHRALWAKLEESVNSVKTSVATCHEVLLADREQSRR